MKKLILVFVLLLLVPAISIGQTIEKPTYVFLNFQVDDNYDKFATNVGFGKSLGSGLYGFSYTTIGEYGSLSYELGYMLKQSEGVFIALLAGPNVDWVDVVDDPIVYIVGAGGAVVGYTAKTDKISYGVHFMSKYKFSFEEDNIYQDGYYLGLGFHIGI